jgi:uncharacterized lipoprotein YmbA
MKIKLMLVAVVVGLLSGCSSKSNFYQLQPSSSTSANTTHAIRHTVVGIAEVEVSGYLNKPEIVTRVNEGRLLVHDEDRWADAFAKNIQSVLRHNLSTLLPKYTFLSKPWDEPIDENYRIYVTIDRFDGDSNGLVVLEGRWSLVNQDDNTVVLSHYFKRKKQGDITLDALVSTQSKLLEELSKEIAKRIRSRV